MAETLCFAEAWEARQSGVLSEAEYQSLLLAHFRGVRHLADKKKPEKSFIYNPPYAKSLRHAALNTEYEPLENTASLDGIFQSCTAGDLEEVSLQFSGLQDTYQLQNCLLQPLATLATEKSHAQLLQFFLDKGATFDRYLDEAVSSGYHKGGAELFEILHAQNWKNIQTSSRALAKFANQEVDAEDDTLLNWLIEHGAKVSRNAVKEAAFHCHSVPIMRRLLALNHGAAVAPGALSHAAGIGDLKLVQLLLEEGANVEAMIPASEMDIREGGPYTPLYEAMRGGHLEVAKVLVEHGAKIDRPYHKNKTPEQAAKGKKKMRELFETFSDTNRIEQKKRRL
jgi:hypothetical protein